VDPRSPRLAALSGLAFVVLFVVAIFILDLAGHDDRDEALNSFYGDAGNRARVVVGAYMLGGAGLAFLWLSYHIRSRLHSVESDSDGVADLGFAGAVVFVVLLFAFGAMQGPTYAASIDFYDEPETQLTRIVPHQGYAMLGYGFLAAALWVAITSATIRSTGAFPVWLSRAGFVVAVLLLLGLLFVPIFLSATALVAWVLAISLVLFREGGAPRKSPG
jgi:hypothetical protein